MTAEIVSKIANKYGCPEKLLADIVYQYEQWAQAEERAMMNADDISPGAETERDNF